MSVFAWLDYSETERRRMMDVIDLFREKGTVDELGLGTIRDAFADLMFPGTSTVMTRASYYLFVPWIYRRLEEKQIPSGEFGDRARRDEVALIDTLARCSSDTNGIIGIESRSKLQRLPSNVYWAGLRLWGIRKFQGSQADYHGCVDDLYRQRRTQRSRSEARDEEHDDVFRQPWHEKLPPPPKSFPSHASIQLRRDDAEFLAHRILTAEGTRKSLLAELVDRHTEWDDDAFIWQHPDKPDWPEALREIVEHAQMFSELLHGASLLYNHLLMRLLGRESDFEELIKWADLMDDRAADYAKWDKARFWEIARSQNPRLRRRETTFVEAWCELVACQGARQLIEHQPAHQLIELRELDLKKANLARLTNPSARQHWNGNSGTAQMDFRWGRARQLLQDIFIGLNRTDDTDGEDADNAPA